MTGRNRQHLLSVAVATVGFLAVQQGASAAVYTWNRLAGGTFNWDYVSPNDNWDQSVGEPNTNYPNAAGDVANINVDVAADTMIRLPASGVTVGVLNMGDSSAPLFKTLLGAGASNTDKLILDNGAAAAQINFSAAPAEQRHYSNFQMTTDVVITNTSGFTQRLYGPWSGGKAMTLASGALTRQIYFNPGVGASNNFSSFTISNLTKAGLSGNSGLDTVNCDITILGDSNTDCVQQYVSEVVNDHATVTWTGARKWNMGGASETLGALAGGRFAWMEANGATPSTLTLAGPFDGLNRDFAGEVGDGEGGSPGVMTVIKKGAFTQTFSGPGSNDLAHTRVENGILALNKDAGVTAVGRLAFQTNDLTLGDGQNPGLGEVKLLAPDQIVDNTAIIFKGGIFNANGKAETVGVASLLVNSEIQMLAGSSSILAFADSSASAWTGGTTLTIKGWDGSLAGGGAEQVLFGSSASGLTPAQVSQIFFLDPLGAPAGTYGASILSSGEVVPLVPEPAILGMVAMSSLLVLRRRRHA